MNKMFWSMVWGLAVVMALMMCTVSAGGETWRKPDLFREAAEGTVVIYSAESWDAFVDEEYAFGSGFFINETGIVATNSHVIEGGEMILIKTVHGEVYDVIEVIGDYPSLDLALLLADIPEEEIHPLALSLDEFEIGEEIFIVGSPAGMEYTFSNGIISSFRPQGVGTEISTLQFTAPISAGSSGGPILNEKAEVIGLVVASLADPEAQNINFGIPVSYLLDILDEHEIDFYVWEQEEEIPVESSRE